MFAYFIEFILLKRSRERFVSFATQRGVATDETETDQQYWTTRDREAICATATARVDEAGIGDDIDRTAAYRDQALVFCSPTQQSVAQSSLPSLMMRNGTACGGVTSTSKPAQCRCSARTVPASLLRFLTMRFAHFGAGSNSAIPMKTKLCSPDSTTQRRHWTRRRRSQPSRPGTSWWICVNDLTPSSKTH